MLLSYRGRSISATDVAFIVQLMAEHPGLSRRKFSAVLARAWNMVQPNGALRDMVCRSMLLVLERAGHLQLPPKRCSPPNPLAVRVKPQADPTLAGAAMETSLSALGPLEIRLVRRTESEDLFGRLMQTFHYLGYTQPVGEHLKYVVYAQDQPIACLAWSSAPRHLKPRDTWIGWTPAQRKQNIRGIAYNTRFLILPWVRVPHLASHLLGQMARRISRDWQSVYAHRIQLLETFIDPERFKGTCYRAANWIYLGQTTGRGKADHTHRANRSLKELWVYPVAKDFRQQLCQSDVG